MEFLSAFWIISIKNKIYQLVNSVRQWVLHSGIIKVKEDMWLMYNTVRPSWGGKRKEQR